jgi:hypothetical protein
LSSHTILRSVMYPTSFVSTGQPYKNTQNCAKSSKNHPSWLSGNPKLWKIYWWEFTSPLDLHPMINVKNVTMHDVQKHPIHTDIQQHTYRRRIHHILQCQLQNRKYYLPPGKCNLWPSIRRRN